MRAANHARSNKNIVSWWTRLREQKNIIEYFVSWKLILAHIAKSEFVIKKNEHSGTKVH